MSDEKILFKNQFTPTSDDMLLLNFLEQKAFSIFSRLLSLGYSKNAIADGFIYAINQWRNK